MAKDKIPTRGRVILEEIKSRNYEIRDVKGKAIEIPESGSLGLLAQGYLGVLAVRKKRKEILDAKEAKETKNKE